MLNETIYNGNRQGEKLPKCVVAKVYPPHSPYWNDKYDRKQSYRLFDMRRLDTLEVLTLMDMPEDMIKKLISSKIMSMSAIHKLAGNSIVVACLRKIFANIWLSHDVQFYPVLNDRLRMVTLCSGYDSQLIAVRQFLADYNRANGTTVRDELLAWSEFDPESSLSLEEQPAVMAHNLLFPEYYKRNLGDLTKIDWKAWRRFLYKDDRDIDLLTYSTPCQSISVAGKHEGLKKGSGTKSSILWNVEDCIATLKPKFLLQENVRALVDVNNHQDFKDWCAVCEKHGYNNYYAVLDAADYGVPQHRERVFMLSVRKDLGLPAYRFPDPVKLNTCLHDIMREEVDIRFYVQTERIMDYLEHNPQDSIGDCRYVFTDHYLTNEEIYRTQTEPDYTPEYDPALMVTHTVFEDEEPEKAKQPIQLDLFATDEEVE